MSSAIAVFHGAFGRVCLYAMDRQMAPHAHREGHLIFHVEGPAATVMADDRLYPLSAGQAVAISPWQAHYYRPIDLRTPTLVLVLYIRPGWFLEASRRASSSLRFGRVGVEVTDPLARHVYATARAMFDPDHEDPLLEDRIATLSQGAFDQSWQWTARGLGFTGPALPARDFRIRKAVRLLQDRLGETLELDAVAREAGLSTRQLERLFRKYLSRSPARYYLELRLNRARLLLLQTNLSVIDVALACGFVSASHFSKCYRDFFGRTPRKERGLPAEEGELRKVG